MDRISPGKEEVGVIGVQAATLSLFSARIRPAVSFYVPSRYTLCDRIEELDPEFFIGSDDESAELVLNLRRCGLDAEIELIEAGTMFMPEPKRILLSRFSYRTSQ